MKEVYTVRFDGYNGMRVLKSRHLDNELPDRFLLIVPYTNSDGNQRASVLRGEIYLVAHTIKDKHEPTIVTGISVEDDIEMSVDNSLDHLAHRYRNHLRTSEGYPASLILVDNKPYHGSVFSVCNAVFAYESAFAKANLEHLEKLMDKIMVEYSENGNQTPQKAVARRNGKITAILYGNGNIEGLFENLHGDKKVSKAFLSSLHHHRDSSAQN
jgi:hypothetical protein